MTAGGHDGRVRIKAVPMQKEWMRGIGGGQGSKRIQ